MGKHRWNQGGNSLCLFFLFCGTDSGRDFPQRRCPFFPVPKNTRQIYPTQKLLKFTPISKHFPNGFSACSTLVCVAAFGCQYFYAVQPRWNRLNDFDFPRQKSPPNPLQWRSPNRVPHNPGIDKKRHLHNNLLEN